MADNRSIEVKVGLLILTAIVVGIATTSVALALVAADARDFRRALTLAAAIGDAAARDVTYQNLSAKFAAQSDLRLAEETARAIGREATRNKALDHVARTIADKTRATEAFGRLGEFSSPRQRIRFLLAVAQRI